MSEMIERVARAIAVRRAELMLGADPATQVADERELARVAMEAMRAVPEVCHDDYRCDKMWRELNSTEVWNLWLDVALGDAE